ncbi:MAG: hypothetical protein P1U56_16220 [Saprospiraceae bacterium]|nr:hypothetical protein [Saprospiraceae bacterium]
MNHYKLGFYTLLLSIIFIACDKDEVAPTIELLTPQESEMYITGDMLTVMANIEDNIELDLATIQIEGPENQVESRQLNLSGTLDAISEVFELTFTNSGSLTVSIIATDKAGNSFQRSTNVEYTYVETGSIDINIKLQFDGAPLVLFEPYTYPDGKTINFTRCSFYTSDIKIDEVLIDDVQFHNLNVTHSTLDLAMNGYTYTLPNVPTGNYSNLRFNIGVPPELNKMDPGDFPSGHPLAKPAENWFSWMSYIFLKVEGNIDLDGDGNTETGIALHTGSDVALRTIELPVNLIIENDKKIKIELVFDLHQFFDGPERIYPIEENPQIHSLSQIDAVIELSNNLLTSIHKN